VCCCCQCYKLTENRRDIRPKIITYLLTNLSARGGNAFLVQAVVQRWCTPVVQAVVQRCVVQAVVQRWCKQWCAVVHTGGVAQWCKQWCSGTAERCTRWCSTGAISGATVVHSVAHGVVLFKGKRLTFYEGFQGKPRGKPGGRTEGSQA
jgi:hypothetical protein